MENSPRRPKGSPSGSSEANPNDSDCRGQSHLKLLAGEERARLRGRIRTTDYTPGHSVRTAKGSPAGGAGERSETERVKLHSQIYTVFPSAHSTRVFRCTNVGNGLDHSVVQLWTVNGTEIRRCSFREVNTANRVTIPSGSGK